MPFQALNFDLQHCFGIKKLTASWTTDANGTMAIYAPNGMMKSSLARTLQCVADGIDPQDEMYPDRVTTCRITIETGADLAPESILVVPPYKERFEHSSRISTLLVNPKLRDRYQEIEAVLEEAVVAFVKDMNKACGRRTGAEDEISHAFMQKPGALLDAMKRIREEVEETDDAPWKDVKYSVLFDPKIKDLLNNKEVHELIAGYVDRLNALLADSSFFSRDTFSYWSAEQVASSLEKHGFFDAAHHVNLRDAKADGETRTIKSKSDLLDILDAERIRIAEDADLRARYEKLGKLLDKNDQVRAFKACLDEHPGLIPLLENYDALRQDVWKSYFVAHKGVFLAVTSAYEAAREERQEIQAQAKKERTRWEEVIGVFNERFHVPFRLRATNHVDLVLGIKNAMELAFDFKEEGADPVPVDRGRLLETLSQGEKRAMYLLDVLFEVEARRKDGVPTLFVFDDIADSFDYKNKYAIVRYLEDLKGHDGSRTLILTHNFDFLRAVEGSVVTRSRCRIAVKYSDRIALEEVPGIRNIFTKDWKGNFFADPLKRLASIPFMRNMVEYLRGEENDAYQKLTSLLHWKSTTAHVTNADLDELFNELFDTNGAWEHPRKPVLDLILECADGCLGAPEGLNFPNKVVLSLASRLLADRHMRGKLGDEVDEAAIKTNQTRNLFRQYVTKFGVNTDGYDTLHRTVLITPEHLHLNAFMYEPLMDVSDSDLRRLYNDLKELPA